MNSKKTSEKERKHVLKKKNEGKKENGKSKRNVKDQRAEEKTNQIKYFNYWQE